jgi:hypothetical protein
MVQTHMGEGILYDMAVAMWRNVGNIVMGCFYSWRQIRPWLALPWREACLSVRICVMGDSGVSVIFKFVFDDFIPKHILGNYRPRSCLALRLSFEPAHAPIFRRVLKALWFLPKEEEWGQRATTLLTATHPRACPSESCPISERKGDNFRHIMELEHVASEQRQDRRWEPCLYVKLKLL